MPAVSHFQYAQLALVVALAVAPGGCAQSTSNTTPTDGGFDLSATPVDGSSTDDLRGVDLSGADLTSSGCPTACNGAHESCFMAQCTCDAGYIRQENGAPATAACLVDTSIHTQVDICSKYTTSGTVPASFFTKAAATCDPGMFTTNGLANALARVNFFRWLVGLPAVTTDNTQNASAQKCALVTASNPANASAHNPPPSSTCYTADGATSAGVSNIAYAPQHYIDAMELWIADTSNATNLGNRREVFRRTLDPVGLGFYSGGTLGSAACLQRTTTNGTGDTPEFIAYPPPGIVPLPLASHIWSFSYPGLSALTPIAATVIRQSDSANLAVTVATLLVESEWEDTISIRGSGWTPAAGETYRVTVTAGTFTWKYSIKPVSCP